MGWRIPSINVNARERVYHPEETNIQRDAYLLLCFAHIHHKSTITIFIVSTAHYIPPFVGPLCPHIRLNAVFVISLPFLSTCRRYLSRRKAMLFQFPCSLTSDTQNCIYSRKALAHVFGMSLKTPA